MVSFTVTCPKTNYGQEYCEWAKVIHSVDPNTKDGYGYDGDWVKRGTQIEVVEGELVVECAGYKSKRDEYRDFNKLHILWKFNSMSQSWEEVSRSTDRDWAVRFKVLVERIFEEGDF